MQVAHGTFEIRKLHANDKPQLNS